MRTGKGLRHARPNQRDRGAIKMNTATAPRPYCQLLSPLGISFTMQAQKNEKWKCKMEMEMENGNGN